jgi:hypothetical protein
MSTQNDVINVNVQIGGSAITRAGFGVALVADAGGSMPERIRFYESASAAAADAIAGAITAAQSAHVAAAFSQSRRPARVAVGRISYTAVAQVVTFTVGGGTDGDYIITINGTDYTHTASSQTASQIATALAALVNADPDVGAAAVGAVVTVTASVAGTGFTFGSESTGSAITESQTQANVSIATELAAVAAENNDWYGLHLVSRVAANILVAASWAESAGKLHVAQTSDAGVLTSVTNDIASQLVALNRQRTHLRWYSVDAAPMAFALLAERLAYDIDVQAVPGWGAVRLSGVTANDSAVSDTAKVNARAKRAGLYLSLLGQAATDSNAGGIRMGNGDFIDARIVADWLQARITEDTAALLLSQASLGRQIPFTDAGFEQLGAVALNRLDQGIALGHLEAAVNAQGDTISPVVTLPLRASLAPNQVAARAYAYTCSALLAGGVATVQVNGVLTDDLALLAQLI